MWNEYSRMKIHIFYGFKHEPWGGANQFLKFLKKYFISQNNYESNPQKADIILFNSYPFNEEWRFKELIKLKRLNKIIIHRINGPLSIVRGDKVSRLYDDILYCFNQLYADATIFQSNWSKAQNYRSGLKKNKMEQVILNATDPTIFRYNQRAPDKNKIEIVAISWSKNIKKGFKTYSFLDDNLDFSKYEMIFIGNSPFKFKNINQIDPISTTELAKRLSEYDIYLTASIDDPCSNSLIEAISAGLVILAVNSGGHPEILAATNSGLLFDDESVVIQKLEELVDNFTKFSQNIKPLSITRIGDEYIDFFNRVDINKKPTFKKEIKFWTHYSLKKSQLFFERSIRNR
ncbi:MAG: glycosyltransferase [Candidatus Hermodarchaeota archaeon]